MSDDRRSEPSGRPPEIAAAGGVLVRAEDDGSRRLAVVHRPKYLDWSLPKGKLEKGEEWREAALREVREETGYRAEAGRELSPVSYEDRKGRAKVVRYFLMRPLEGEFEPNSEVDELRWVDAAEAEELLTYEHDRELVRDVMRGGFWRGVLRGLRGFSRRPWPGM